MKKLLEGAVVGFSCAEEGNLVEFDNPADGVQAGEAGGADFFVGVLTFDIARGK